MANGRISRRVSVSLVDDGVGDWDGVADDGAAGVLGDSVLKGVSRGLGADPLPLSSRPSTIATTTPITATMTPVVSIQAAR